MTKDGRHKSFYFITAIIGIALMILEISFYRKTIIPLKALFLVTIIPSIIVFFIIKSDYKRTYQVKNIFFPFLQSVASFGFITCYCFIALNYYLADTNIQVKSCEILNKHSIGTRHSEPAVEINYDGTEKQLVFNVGQQNLIDSSRYVLLTVKKGFFGYDIFSDVALK